MIKEDYVSYETAKLLRQKGFNESCFAQYDGHKEITFGLNKNDWSDSSRYHPSAPTLQMAMKWLREVHNFSITAFPAWDNDDGTKMSFEKWGESIDGLDGEYCIPISGPVYYNSYEEACEAAIKYCLENLI